MVEFLTPRITPTARAAGRVSNAGSQSLQRLSNAVQGTADNFTEFWEKEAALQGEQFLAEVQAEWGRTYNERAKAAGNGFAKGILKDYDTFVADRMQQRDKEAAERGQANVPERNRREVQAALDKYRLRLETKALSREAAARAAAKARAASATRRLKLNALISDPGLLDEYLETAKSPKERSDYVKTALGMNMRTDPQGVMDQVMGGQWDADLRPSEKMSMIKLADSGIARQKRERDIELKADQKAYESTLQEEVAYAEANGAAPVDSDFDEETITDLYANDPERGAEVKKAYKDAVSFAETVSDVATAPASEIQMEIENLQAKIKEPGETKADVEKLNQYVAAIDRRNNAIRNDGATYVQSQSDFVSGAYSILQEAPPETAAVAADKYVEGMDFNYDRLGVPPELRTLLPKQDAANQVAQFNEMGSDVAAQALSEYAATWGDAAPRVLAQLDKAGLAKEYSVAMRHVDNPGLSQAIVNLSTVDINELTQGLPTASVTETRQELSEMMVDYRTAFEFAGGPDAAEMMNKHYAVAEKLAIDLVRRGSDPSDAVERAVTQMFPETAITGNNENYILPQGLDSGDVSTGLDQMRSETQLRQSDIQAINDPRFPDFADLEVTISQASRSGIWVNNSSGDGLQLMISLDGYLLPLVMSDGSPYELEYSEAQALGRSFIAGIQREIQ